MLSRSTEAYDRGDEWAAYRKLASVSEYFLVSQSVVLIERFRRQGTGWHYEATEAGGRISLGAGLELDVDALYEGVFTLPGD